MLQPTRFPLVLLTVLMTALLSCHSPENNPDQPAPLPEVSENQQWQIILSFDTLRPAQRLQRADSMLEVMQSFAQRDQDPYYNYFKGYHFQFNHQEDSALYYYRQIQPNRQQVEASTLKEYGLHSVNADHSGIAGSGFMTSMMKAVETAEKNKSLFIYKLYDLLAEAYYRNRNAAKAEEYTQLYYTHHPLRAHSTIQQRYHDISFMLSVRRGDTKTMRQHLDSSRQLALHIGDSMALMRSYENEAQLQSMLGQPALGLESNRKSFLFMQRKGMLNLSAFNNMAKSFLNNQQTDSTITYFKAAIQWAQQQAPAADLVGIYGGLNEAYRKKGDFKKAHTALDSVLQIYVRNTQAIQAEKIEEIHTQYETEKKDRSIASLKTTNALNKKIIAQQRWIFAGAGVLLLVLVAFMYVTYRRRLLLEKNEKLLIENKRLALEQKTRQMQLNPHFIYNAIANLQGLISSGKKQQANAYLLAFSQLMRDVLELNRHELITLEEEIVSLKNYLELQQMRFEALFDYQILTGELDTSAVVIPPMLLQPFVENAIEHGFKNITYKGELRLTIRAQQEQLHICIHDNGLGTDAQAPALSGKKSLSRTITQERLDVLFNTEKQKAFFDASALPEKGFVVNIFLPLLNA